MKVGPLGILVKVIKVIFRPDDHTVVLFFYCLPFNLLLSCYYESSKFLQNLLNFFLNPGQNLVTLDAIH